MEIPPSSSLEPMKKEKSLSPPTPLSGSEELQGSELNRSSCCSESTRALFFKFRLPFFFSADSNPIVAVKASEEQEAGFNANIGLLSI